MTMKKILILLAILMLPITTQAATFSTDQVLPKDQVINDNYYVAGDSPTILGTVNGDLMIAGGNIVVAGDVKQNLEVAGGNVTITGNVGGNLRVFAGAVVLSGKVGGDTIIAAGDTTVDSEAEVGKDLVIAAGTITVSPQAKVTGKTMLFKDEGQKNKPVQESVNQTINIAGFLFGTLILLFSAAILFAVFPVFTKSIGTHGAKQDNLFKYFGIGLLALVVTPILAIISFITGVGVIIGFIMLLLYVFVILVSIVYGGLIFGQIIQRMTTKNPQAELNWGWALGGVALLNLITIIPLIGWLIGFFFFLLAFGTILPAFWSMLKNQIRST